MPRVLVRANEPKLHSLAPDFINCHSPAEMCCSIFNRAAVLQSRRKVPNVHLGPGLALVDIHLAIPRVSSTQLYSTMKNRIIVKLLPYPIRMGDGDIMALFSGVMTVLALGAAATFWFLLH